MNLRKSVKEVSFLYDRSFVPTTVDEVMKGYSTKYGKQHSYKFNNQHRWAVVVHTFTPSSATEL